jgi:uncharacterized 2Fe-2S/4Fe-4S cluster protein (DUF4445 family)
MNSFGIALDIGTTTVQAELVDLDSAKCLDTFFAFNNQRSFGTDVISRINAAGCGKLNDLFSAINKQTENILCYFIHKYNLPRIKKCIVSGNTTMLHFFCRTDPSDMGTAPYTPAFLDERSFPGGDISLSADTITMLPGASAFLGADFTAGLALIDIMNINKNALFVDIGTNGEIAVWKKNEKKIFCCSTAAGPCFEGADISCDLCASDFIDVIANMKRINAIDKTGVLSNDEFVQNGYHLKEGKVITQNDIRKFQLAKSAIYSGIKTLCRISNTNFTNIDIVFIAGGLGERLNLENAAELGLIPRELAEKAVICGNTSLKGAAKCLLDPGFIMRCKKIISNIKAVDLANEKYFSAAFTHNIGF